MRPHYGRTHFGRRSLATRLRPNLRLKLTGRGGRSCWNRAFLTAAANAPQLKRNPLGSGCMVVRLLVFICVLTGCASSIRDALPRLVPTSPETPQSDADVLMQLALRRAVVDEKAVPDYGLLPDPTTIVVLKQDSSITARILPQTSNIRFLLLSADEIRDLADRYGHFVYINVSAWQIQGDSGRAGASTKWTQSRRNRGVVYLSGGSCAWQFRKREGTWHFDKPLGCLIS